MFRSAIEKKAAGLLVELDIKKPPVPVEEIPEHRGLRVVFEPFDDEEVSGMLYREGGAPPSIVVNSRNARLRQRFTIAHELGHALLHKGNIYVDTDARVHFRDSKSGLAVSGEEMDANAFAAALLMPQAWVLEEANRRLQRRPRLADESLIQQLARVFDVSQQAMQYRLTNLGVIQIL